MNSFTLAVSTLLDDGTGNLRSIKPDSQGIYRGFPAAVLGKISNNQLSYDIESSLRAMGDTTARFARAIQSAGGCEGEWGHPVIFQKYRDPDRRMEALNRMLTVDRMKVSHRIVGIHQEQMGDGLILIRVDVIPAGPLRQQFIDEMSSSVLNVGLSLRALTTATTDNPMLQTMRAMVTFDAVNVAGFDAATKRGIISTEDYQLPVELGDLLANVNVRHAVAVEDITNQQLLDTLGLDRVTICHESFGVFDPAHVIIHRTNGAPLSAFHALFGKWQEQRQYR